MRRIRNRHLFLLDAIGLALIPFGLFALRAERMSWTAVDLGIASGYALFAVPTQLAVYVAFGIYRRLWRYASVGEMQLILFASIVAAIATFAEGVWLLPLLAAPARVPLSIWFNGAVLSGAVLLGSRLYVRIGGWKTVRRNMAGSESRVLIAGAGSAGQMILKEMLTTPDLHMHPVGFVDDDETKHGLHIGNHPVLGSLADTPKLVRDHEVGEIVIAMPKAPGNVIRQVVRAALDAGIPARTVPGMYEILSGRVRVNALRDVQIEDLLRREPVKTDLAQVAALASDKSVIVTGAGGSIGSELCRQLARLGPKCLILLGHGENSIFDVLHELRPKFPTLQIVPVVADVRDRRRIFQIFEDRRPFAVFHAAAHKHVPLMEENVIEAVTNNVMGTRNLVDAAVEFHVEHFVLISTDKAVRPTNVMGATKRVAEHVVRAAAMRHKKNFVAVRFGNVLGSRGSVVPTFVKQIRDGGPVTITHPEMRRFFMTIPEAVQLVLQAGAMGRGGELFMLDMGEPVRVVDLARDLIRLSGLEEGTDIEIHVTGIRRGEKLYEEMFFSDEIAAPTTHPKVLRARNHSLEAINEGLINDLTLAAESGAGEETLREMLKCVVPDFVPMSLEAASEPTPSAGVPLHAWDESFKRRTGSAGDVIPLRRRSGEMQG